MGTTIQDREVRWGILGVGDVCEVKSAPAMNLVDNSRLVAVMRRNEERAEDYARRHGVPKWYSDADSLIHDPEVNAVYIATPPNAHKDLTLRVAAAGKPVYVEKPMARSYRECQAMIAACRETNVQLNVAYYRRALPHFVKIRELIESGAIGNIRYARVELNQQVPPANNLGNNWRVNPEIAGGGLFYDLASHQLDLLDWLLGPVDTATGYVANQAGQYAAEDIVSAAFRFRSGVQGSGNWCFSTGRVSEKDETVIVGNEGQITYETFGDGRFFLRTDANGEETFNFDLPRHIQHGLITAIVDSLLGRGTSPSTGDSAARTNRVFDEIFGGL